MTTHTITLARHTAQVVGLMGVLVLGTWDSYGTEQLLLRHGPEWDGLAIDATFHNVPNDEGVTVLADTDGLVPVPPEACMRASKYATITIRGAQDGVQRISCNLPYMVLDHAQVPGANSTATPSENAQALTQMQDLRDGAVDAKKHAEAARDDAARSAVVAKESETSAGQSAAAAKTAQSAAETAKAGAETAQKAAASSASSASTFASTATTQAAAAKSSATTAKASEAAAGKSAKEAAASAANLDSAANTATQKAAAASASAAAAKASESAAASSEAAARKYANSAESAAKTAGEAATEKLQQMQAIQDDVTAKQAQTATDATAAEKAKVAAEAAQKDAAASKTAAADSATAAKTSEDAAAKSAADADSTANSINESMTQIAANKEDTAALQKRQNVLVGSETGNPVSCNDAFAAPLCGLTVYGKSTQDETPTPDAPVPIVSAGDSGSVAVKVTGVNLLDINEIFDLLPTQSQSTVKDGHITGTTEGMYAEIGFILKDKLSIQYTVSVSGGAAGLSTELRVYIWDNNSLGNNVTSKTVPAGEKASCTFKTDGKHEYAVWFRPNGVGDYDFYDIQLELGSTVTSYEPYREQLLTLPTPNGLPGIPVTSGGNYTDQNGQQWVCDEVDLERVVKVQRVDKTAFDSTKTLAEQNAILATPIETPLTPAEIAAYKALTAYAPDTVVQASDGAGVKLEYQRDVNIAIKKLEDAIASMTTT